MAQYIVDATSPSYQVDAAHAPDKQSLWAHPMESDGWTHAHNAIRYELAAMSGVLAGSLVDAGVVEGPRHPHSRPPVCLLATRTV